MSRAEESELARQMALRSQAKSLFQASLGHVRGEAGAGQIARRAARRIGEGAAGFAEDAVSKISTKTSRLGIGAGVGIAAGAGLLAGLWFVRKPARQILAGYLSNMAPAKCQSGQPTPLTQDEEPGDDE